MSTVLPLFSSLQKPLTPDRVTRYHQYRRNPTSILNTSLPQEDSSPPPARKSFLTHANSRVYPLTVMGREDTGRMQEGKRNSSTSITLRPPTQAAARAPPKRHTSTRHLNLSVDSSVANSIPHLDYRQFRRQHQQRHNNTTPAKRDFGDYTGQDTGKRFYKPQVVKITPRSKIVLHSSVPITITGPLISAYNTKKKIDKDQLFAAETFESPEKRSEVSPDNSPAVTFAEKLSRLQNISSQAMHS